MNSFYLGEALSALRPNCAFGCGETYDSIEWYSTNSETKPTEEEVAQKVAELTYQKEVEVYKEQRAAEYPPYADQFDKIYHSGVNAWKSQIKLIKDKYPKQTMDATELQTRKDKAIFDLQTKRYIEATERLSQYILSEGLPELTEENVIGQEDFFNKETEEREFRDIIETVIIQTAIEPLEATVEVTETDEETMESTTTTVPNPLIVRDEEERAAAQAVVDSTPQAVIDAVDK